MNQKTPAAVGARVIALGPDYKALIEGGLLRFAELCDFDVRCETLSGAPLWRVYDPSGAGRREVRVVGFQQEDGQRRIYFVPYDSAPNKGGESAESVWHTDFDRIQSLAVEAFGLASWPPLKAGEGGAGARVWVPPRLEADARAIEALLNAVSDRAGWAWFGWDRYDPKPVLAPTFRFGPP